MYQVLFLSEKLVTRDIEYSFDKREETKGYKSQHTNS